MTSLLFSGNCIYVSVALINYNLAVQNYKRQFILIFASFPAAVNSCIFFFLQGKGNLVLDFSLLGLAVEFWYFVFKIVLTYCEKYLFLWSKKNWNSRPKVENLQTFWYQARTISHKEMRAINFPFPYEDSPRGVMGVKW